MEKPDERSKTDTDEVNENIESEEEEILISLKQGIEDKKITYDILLNVIKFFLDGAPVQDPYRIAMMNQLKTISNMLKNQSPNRRG